MKPFFPTLAFAALLPLAGCSEGVKESSDSSKIKVDAPGVKVDIKKSSDADPHPDVNVDVKTKRSAP